MKGYLKELLCALGCFSLCLCAAAEQQDFNTRIPMMNRGASTFYIKGHIDGFGPAFMLVDTGSSYSTITEDTFTVLKQAGHTTFIRELRGTMADGSQRRVPIYRISGVHLGEECHIRDIEVALFPGSKRLILGLSVLRKVSPFTFSIGDAPHMMLSNCQPPENILTDTGSNLVKTSSTMTVSAE